MLGWEENIKTGIREIGFWSVKWNKRTKYKSFIDE
jgi:hypothetical protein